MSCFRQDGQQVLGKHPRTSEPHPLPSPNIGPSDASSNEPTGILEPSKIEDVVILLHNVIWLTRGNIMQKLNNTGKFHVNHEIEAKFKLKPVLS